jgi:FkbM family methyltransferase
MLTDRAKLTISCEDCSYIPKVDNAGMIVEDKYQIMHNGIKVVKDGYHGDWMTTIIRNLKGHHEPQEEKAFYEVLKEIPPKATMIELGSNWSYYSMWFNKKVESPTNIMIEPTEEKIKAGKINFDINNMKGKFAQAFVGREPLKDANFVDWDGKSYTLNQTSVDNIRKEYNLDTVDIVHSDIQGAEYDMLLGSLDSIEEQKINYFFISTHGQSIHEYCMRFLKNKNFYILCSHTEEESYSADGLIVASQRPGKEIQISKRGCE